jgi:hypothetical protein
VIPIHAPEDDETVNPASVCVVTAAWLSVRPLNSMTIAPGGRGGIGSRVNSNDTVWSDVSVTSFDCETYVLADTLTVNLDSSSWARL